MLKFKTKLSLAVAQRPMYTQGGPLCDPPTHQLTFLLGDNASYVKFFPRPATFYFA